MRNNPRFFSCNFLFGILRNIWGKKIASNPLGMGPKFDPKYIGRKNPGW